MNKFLTSFLRNKQFSTKRYIIIESLFFIVFLLILVLFFCFFSPKIQISIIILYNINCNLKGDRPKERHSQTIKLVTFFQMFPVESVCSKNATNGLLFPDYELQRTFRRREGGHTHLHHNLLFTRLLHFEIERPSIN